MLRTSRGDGSRAGGDLARRGRDGEEDVFHLHFSLGKAYEDAGDCPAVFVRPLMIKGNRPAPHAGAAMMPIELSGEAGAAGADLHRAAVIAADRARAGARRRIRSSLSVCRARAPRWSKQILASHSR